MTDGSLDWDLVSRYIAPLLSGVVLFLVNRYYEKQPKIVYSVSHIAAVTIKSTNEVLSDVRLHTHMLVITNTGKKSATSVRVGHDLLPAFNVSPNVSYTMEDLPDGGTELIFPTMPPGEHLEITYIYAPPITYRNINTLVKCDEGLGVLVELIPSIRLPNWQRYTVLALLVVGILTVIFCACNLFSYLFTLKKA